MKDRKNLLVLCAFYLCGAQGICPQQSAARAPLPASLPGTLGSESGLFDRYRGSPVPPVNFFDSPRLETLIRAGTLYLSLRDAITLAIENNLDVEMQRLTPIIAETDILRAQAGGSIRGITASVQEGPSGLGSTVRGAAGQTQGISTTPVETQSRQQSVSMAAATGASGPPVPSLDPAVVGTAGWNRTNRPQTNTFITGTNELTSTAQLGDLRFQQGFLWGGTASLGLDITRQNTNNLRSNINPATTAGLAFTYVQPLLQGFGLAVNNRFIRIAKNNRQVSDLVFEQQVMTTAYTVARLYWDLVSLNSELRVQEQSLALSERLLNDNILQEQAGTLAPIDVVRARAEVAGARRDLTVAQTRVRQQETILLDYITRQTLDAQRLGTLRITPTDAISPPAQDPVQPFQDLVAEAERRRPELAAALLQVENSRISLSGTRSALLPSLDLVVNGRSNALFGPISSLPLIPGSAGGFIERTADPAFVGGAGTGLSQIFRARFPDYGVQLQLTIPLANRAARADYTRDQLSARQQEIRLRQIEKQIGVDVSNALIAVEQSRAAYQAAEEARMFQEQSLEAEREKYAVGVSTNFLVIQYQRDLAEAQSAEVAALADYAKARATLDRVTGGILERYGISIVEAYRGRISSTTSAPGTPPSPQRP
ncbi:MAG: TolC family protein [Bryobacteraceae bacterium]|nr:TolC family protein [Bryobacterales bacterium]NUN01148.1 TolC family protein [Bryobacteraceae bacterium]